MPELPEVEVTRQGILTYVENQVINKIIVRQPKLRWPIPVKTLKNNLLNAKVHSLTRRGKYLLFEVESGYFLIHLGMSGYLRVLSNNHPPGKHDHFDLYFKNNHLIRFNDTRRFGAVLWLGEKPFEHKLLSQLGVEPLTKNFNQDYLYKKSRNIKTNIKTFLMNQKIVVGIGNIYANEALYSAGIHPLRAAASLDSPSFALLVTAIKKILHSAIRQGGTTLKDFSKADGKPGYFGQSLNVYGKSNHPCPQCNQLIQQQRVNQRSTYFCAQCQE